ncbi:MAG TPA: TonB-dependent receptor [Gemmatimonadales bacterium]|nr:TonB-dependent receptor [Gemmatimonadales bacterium]
MRLLYQLSAASLLTVTPLVAQQTDTTRVKKDTVVTLAPIEVVGSIQPAANPGVISSIPARVTILTGKQVDAYEPRVLSEVLSQQPSFSLYDDLGSPYKMNLSTRGFFASPVVGLPQGVSVFLDGVRQNEADAAQVNFDLLPMQYIKRVELLAGTASLTGRNALGGAVNLVTQRGEGPAHGELEVQGGSFSAFNGNGSVGGVTHGGIDYYLGAGYNREDGWRQATGAHQYNGLLNLGRLTDTWGVSLQAFGAVGDARTAGSLPESVFQANPDSNMTPGDYENLDLIQTSLAGYKRMGDGRGSARLYYRRHSGDRFNVNQAADPDALGKSRNSTFGWSFDYRCGKPLGTAVLGLRFGADGTINQTSVQLFADSTKFGGGQTQTTFVKAPLWDAAGFATADLTVGRVTFSAGARYDYIKIPFENQLDHSNDTTSHFSRVSPKGGISVDAGGGASIYASVGQNFRAPAVIELACADPAEPCLLPFSLGDDPPIKPVVATTYEIGGKVPLGPVDFTASLYRSDVRDDIYLFPGSDTLSGSTIDGYFGNIDKTRREGAELGLNLGFGRGHSVYLNYAWTRATFQTIAAIQSPRSDSNVARPGDRIPLVPDQQVKLGAAFQVGNHLTLGADGRFIGHQYLRGDEANEDKPLDTYFVADARATVHFGPWEISGLVNNLFNSLYANFGTYNVNQGNPAGDTLERFLTPGQKVTFRLVVRRSFGGGNGGGGMDTD